MDEDFCGVCEIILGHIFIGVAKYSRVQMTARMHSHQVHQIQHFGTVKAKPCRKCTMCATVWRSTNFLTHALSPICYTQQCVTVYTRVCINLYTAVCIKLYKVVCINLYTTVCIKLYTAVCINCKFVYNRVCLKQQCV